MEAGEVGLIRVEAENNDDAGYHDCLEDKQESDFRVSLKIRITLDTQSVRKGFS